MALKWYDVKIDGRFNDKDRSVETTILAKDESHAAWTAVHREWNGEEVDHMFLRRRDGSLALCFMIGERNGRHYITDHETFEEMATEVTDPARLARLNSDPMLPQMGMEEADGD